MLESGLDPIVQNSEGYVSLPNETATVKPLRLSIVDSTIDIVIGEPSSFIINFLESRGLKQHTDAQQHIQTITLWVLRRALREELMAIERANCDNQRITSEYNDLCFLLKYVTRHDSVTVTF